MIKKLFSILTFSFLSSSYYAQNIPLSEIVNIRKLKLAEIEEYLLTKNYNFYTAKQPQNGMMGTIQFAYNLRNDIDKSESFIILQYSPYHEDAKRILIAFSKIEKYNEFLNQIKSWDGKLIKSFVENDEFCKVYQTSTITYKIYTKTIKENNSRNTIYKFHLMTNSDYIVTN